MKLNELTPKDIQKMSYNELIGLVRETNRTPGGSKSISYISQLCCLQPGKKVLDIGTSTGVTAIELAQLSGCNVVGIDINKDSLSEARSRSKRLGLDKLLTFKKDDATNLSLKNETFDVVFCGNVTSLLSDRQKALNEYSRVLKKTGFLVGIPMYYLKKPSAKLVKDVSSAIRVNITPLYREFWLNFFTHDTFEVFTLKDFKFDNLSPAKVDSFCDMILGRPHLKELSPRTKKALDILYRDYMQLFRKNLSHMGFSILVLKKKDPYIDPELFTSTEL